LLLRKPSHGYELAVRFGELFGPGWEINRGQVYDMVHTLQEKGLVERLPARQTGRRAQQYRVTPEGARAYAEWFGTPSSQSRPHRETFYLKLALAGPNDARHLLESIAIQEQACVDRLRTYAEGGCRAPEEAGEWEILARDMIDEATSTQLHGELELLGKMRRRIERLLEDSPDSSQSSVARISEQRRIPA
jgi:DNA-binding PadR family transcriptional regulator